MKPTLVALFAFLLAATAHATDRPPLLILGSAHLDNPGHDLVNTTVENVLTPKRQAEIVDMVDRLAAFRPTHVAVEWAASKQAKLDERYAAYLAGTYELTADERDQIGLRLAKKLGLKRVDAIDWNEDAPGKDEDYDYIAWAKAHGRQAQYDAYLARVKAWVGDEAGFRRSHSVTEWFLQLNSPSYMATDAKLYFDLAQIGDDTMNPGAAWVGQWYARNLRIFNHIRALATSPNDRIFVVYGAGHLTYLRKDAVESEQFTLVEPSTYLTGAK